MTILDDSDHIHDLFYTLAVLGVIKGSEVDHYDECIICDRFRKGD